MKCPNCKAYLENGARYCNKCAAIFPKPLYEEKEETKQEVTTEYKSEKKEEVDSKGIDEKGNVFFNILLYIISIASPIIGIALYYYYKNKRPKSANIFLMLGILSFIISGIILFFKEM